MAGDVDVHQSVAGRHCGVGCTAKQEWTNQKGHPSGRPWLCKWGDVYLAFMRESISSILALRSALTCCKLARSPMNFM